MKCFVVVLLLALFAVAMAAEEKPQVEKVGMTKEAPVGEAARDKRGAVIVTNPYAPLAYSAYSPYTYSVPYPYHYSYYRYSYPYGSLSFVG